MALLVSSLILGGCGRSAVDGAANAGGGVTLQNKGSDTIVNLALAWAEAYQEVNPQVRIAVTGGGSGTGLTALINGTVDIANASRRIKEEELAAARANHIEPQELVIARDAIAVVVHPSNPVDHLTLQQISDIYSGKITNWREVGGEDRPIVLLSRETNSGTHVYFLEEVIRLGQKDNKILFSPDTLLLPSSEGIGAEVRQNPNAIGYDGLGYVTPDMKTLEVGLTLEGPFWPPTAATVNAGQYPIARDLYMYSRAGASEAVTTYLEWILSPEAQNIVLELGFVPIAATE
ncbi:MAG: Phosphate-binding protein PstS precursor [Chloroflexi bacterium ADurb.Bin222]|nr:MAG: Phosphate-binding protein PstS precursor [Chloroflexi bacterium ADurb.Bin222]